ncbi:hypothetical protein BC835DRAFT_1412739 [Cytidiella melzeri]|nr:hypothetical protein BC835DRAFT_1412739 [Cytidiella melzeri]
MANNGHDTLPAFKLFWEGFQRIRITMARLRDWPTQRSHSHITPTKRSRIDTEREFVHDTNIWMSDGNVIIAVEDPDDDLKRTYAFKCHMSVLAKHSNIFEALFTLPQSQDDAETYDGVPLVVLPDPYQDVKELLQMLYDPK